MWRQHVALAPDYCAKQKQSVAFIIYDFINIQKQTLRS